MSLFGKDIEENICTLITFADGASPPVLASLEELKLPFGQKFIFNNSALFAENVDSVLSMSPMFWKMGCISLEKLFRAIMVLNTKSLFLTKRVLDEREKLRTIIATVLSQVSAGLSKISELNIHLDMFEKNTRKIKDNENFEYTVEETRQEVVTLPKGKYMTTCIHCSVTCHEMCTVEDNTKAKCDAMDGAGYCTICPGKCYWTEHKLNNYRFKFHTVPVTKTYAEMKKRYENAVIGNHTTEKNIKYLTKDLNALFEDASDMMREMSGCKKRQEEIALRPDPLLMEGDINLMISLERKEKRPGYCNRIMMLEKVQKMACVDQNFALLKKNNRM